MSLHLLDLGGDISGNGLSKLFLTVAAAFAEAERDRIRERVSQVKADQKARRRFLGGNRPFGFQVVVINADGDKGLIADEAEQAAIGAMLELRAGGASLRTIQAAIAAKGHQLTVPGIAKLLRGAADLTYAPQTN